MKALFATAAVVASIAAAPTALGSTQNLAIQNEVNAANAARGESTVTGLITENSATQNRIQQPSTVTGLITENSATQNRIQQPATVTVVTSSGFDWADAGIGAAGGVGLMLVALGGSVVVLRRRDRTMLAV